MRGGPSSAPPTSSSRRTACFNSRSAAPGRRTISSTCNSAAELNVFCPQCGTWNRASSAVCVRCTDPLPELARPAFEQPAEEITRLRRATGNRYRVLHRLGGGGMAEVYVAEQVQLARRVVLKVLHPHLGRDAEVAERFRREAEAAAKLVHPNICAIFDYGASGDVVYTVMPLFE